jgi:hypothetical protein
MHYFPGKEEHLIVQDVWYLFTLDVDYVTKNQTPLLSIITPCNAAARTKLTATHKRSVLLS